MSQNVISAVFGLPLHPKMLGELGRPERARPVSDWDYQDCTFDGMLTIKQLAA
jgi:hypothetical protein